MTEYHISEHTELTRDWSNAVASVFNQPDAYLERLCDLANKDQNLNRNMDWDSVNLTKIPRQLRQSVANMFAQFHYGETIGVMCVSRMVDLCPSATVKPFFQSQAVDEGRHVKWLSMLMQKLHCEGQVNPVSEQLMTEIYNSGSLLKMVLGIHVFIEGLAQSYCVEGAQAFSKTGPLQLMNSSYRSARKVIGKWLPEFIGRDESRHIAFGQYFLKKMLPTLTRAHRDELELFAQHLGSLIVEGVRHPDLVFAPGLDGPAAGARSVDKINRQLGNIGFDARIPDVYR